MMTSFRVKTACALVMGGGAVFAQHGVAAELTIATVDNRDMLRMRELSQDFVASRCVEPRAHGCARRVAERGILR